MSSEQQQCKEYFEELSHQMEAIHNLSAQRYKEQPYNLRFSAMLLLRNRHRNATNAPELIAFAEGMIAMIKWEGEIPPEHYEKGVPK